MNCVCGHPEKDHVSGGRCRVPDCSCERFQPGDTFRCAMRLTHARRGGPVGRGRDAVRHDLPARAS